MECIVSFNRKLKLELEILEGPGGTGDRSGCCVKILNNSIPSS